MVIGGRQNSVLEGDNIAKLGLQISGAAIWLRPPRACFFGLRKVEIWRQLRVKLHTRF